MNVYADYEFYQDVYLGKSIGQADFPAYALRATAYINWLTNDRVNDVTEAVKMATCAVADTLKLNEDGGGIASQSVGKWSVNYVAGISKSKTDEQRLADAAKLYLGNSDLLNRWC